MGLLSGLIKIALTPVAVVKDVVNVITDEAPDATKNLLESAQEDIEESIGFDV